MPGSSSCTWSTAELPPSGLGGTLTDGLNTGGTTSLVCTGTTVKAAWQLPATSLHMRAGYGDGDGQR